MNIILKLDSHFKSGFAISKMIQIVNKDCIKFAQKYM